MRTLWFGLVVVGLAVGAMMARGTDIELVKDGVAVSAIYVSADVMAPNATPAQPTWLMTEQENQRQRLRESVTDLALYLKKMSCATCAIGVTPKTTK